MDFCIEFPWPSGFAGGGVADASLPGGLDWNYLRRISGDG